MFSDEFLEKILGNKIMMIMPICYQSASIRAFEDVLADIVEEKPYATISELYTSKSDDAVSDTIPANEQYVGELSAEYSE